MRLACFSCSCARPSKLFVPLCLYRRQLLVVLYGAPSTETGARLGTVGSLEVHERTRSGVQGAQLLLVPSPRQPSAWRDFLSLLRRANRCLDYVSRDGLSIEHLSVRYVWSFKPVEVSRGCLGRLKEPPTRLILSSFEE